MEHRYLLSGVLVTSTIPLPCAPIGPRDPEGAGPALHLALADHAAAIDAGPWEERDTGLSIGRFEGGFVVRHPRYADFVIDASRARVTAMPRAGCPLAIVEQLFLDQVFPLVLHARGGHALHASAALLPDGRVAAFLGRSGLGKSTLAASFASSKGHALFSDDCLALRADASSIVAYPSYPSSRLWPPSAEALFASRGELPLVSPRSDKRRVALDAAREGAVLARVYLLEVGDAAPTITRLGRAQALGMLAAHLHRLDVDDRALLAGELDLLDALVRRVPVARLAYRRAFDELDAVRAAVLADA